VKTVINFLYFLFLSFAIVFFRIKRFFKREGKYNVILDQEKLKKKIPDPPNSTASLPQTPLGADSGERTDN